MTSPTIVLHAVACGQRHKGKSGTLSAIPPPTPHRTETKKAEADQAEGRGFGDGRAWSSPMASGQGCATRLWRPLVARDAPPGLRGYRVHPGDRGGRAGTSRFESAAQAAKGYLAQP
jgi:hypothetical protein